MSCSIQNIKRGKNQYKIIKKANIKFDVFLSVSFFVLLIDGALCCRSSNALCFNSDMKMGAVRRSRCHLQIHHEMSSCCV